MLLNVLFYIERSYSLLYILPSFSKEVSYINHTMTRNYGMLFFVLHLFRGFSKKNYVTKLIGLEHRFNGFFT